MELSRVWSFSFNTFISFIECDHYLLFDKNSFENDFWSTGKSSWIVKIESKALKKLVQVNHIKPTGKQSI